ncbi:MAG: DUF4367 domain-containing protein [Clostridia bacterium]
MKAQDGRPIVEQPKDRSLSDQAYDLFGELLLEQETNQLLEEIEDEKSRGATSEMDAFFAVHDQKNLKRIHSYFHRQHMKKLLTRTLPKAIQVAAIFIACISIAGGIAFATNETVRVYVMKLIVTMSDEYTSLKLVEDEDASFDVPADWQGENYPSYLPADLQVTAIHSYMGYHSVAYQGIENILAKLDFSELSSEAETNLDTENAAVTAIMVQNYPGFLATKEDKISIYWSNGHNYFILFAQNMDEGIVLRIAENVKNIR